MMPVHAPQDGDVAALDAPVVHVDVVTWPDCFPVDPFGPSPAFLAWLGTLLAPPTPRARARHAAEMAQRARERDPASRANGNAAACKRRGGAP